MRLRELDDQEMLERGSALKKDCRWKHSGWVVGTGVLFDKTGVCRNVRD
ncbi:hypothetical protein [Chlorobium phaeobacteroides]|nr:hypothetical protein [Chlorobium phaeobacteroides]